MGEATRRRRTTKTQPVKEETEEAASAPTESIEDPDAAPGIHIAHTIEEATSELGEQTEAQQAGYDIPDAPAPEEVPESSIPGITAFYVLIQSNGRAVAVADCNVHLTLQRQPSAEDIKAACREVADNVEIFQVSSATADQMMARGAQLAEQQRIQRMTEKLKAKGMHVKTSPQGIIVPG